MGGREYLLEIRTKLESGSHQNRAGQSLLKAFGYVRRRATAVAEINSEMEDLGLEANPPVNSEMPLKAPRIRFSLRNANGITAPEAVVVDGSDLTDSERFESPLSEAENEDTDIDLPEPAFSVSELKSASANVECVPPDAPIDLAYTKMVRDKYSQLVVASGQNPRQTDIKGVVSFQSMAKALMNGDCKTVGDCIDRVPIVQRYADLKSVIGQLSENDVVLVVGHDQRLQGIVTAWDLAEEFAELVDPFKRIGEIEGRLRSLIGKRIGNQTAVEFLADRGFIRNDQIDQFIEEGLDELTMWELERVLDFPDHWDALALRFDRNVFIEALAEVRGFRNRLMHFKDPLKQCEMTRLTNVCDMVREIPMG